MGIPCFYSYILKNYDIIQSLQNQKVDNLYLDCYSIIYNSIPENIEKCKNIETLIINDTVLKIKQILNLLKPSNICYIAFDGIAPVAKLKQQRARRYRNQLIKKILDEETGCWDTAAITPGTNFMNKLDTKIYSVFKDPKNFGLKELIVSGTDECGEGEHKLFEYIRNNVHKNDKHTSVIYGLDADLIMLSINHIEYCENLFLYRETPEFIKSINSELNPTENYLLDINCLTKTIAKELSDDEDNIYISKDYVFLCFLLGNDFMPHIPSINIRTNGMHILLDVYKHLFLKSGEKLIQNKKISWKNVRKLFKTLSEIEEQNIRNECDKRSKFKRELVDKKDKLNFLPMTERSIENYINPFDNYWNDRYYAKLFDFESNTTNVKNACINYLEALEWTFKYYTEGCYDWRWQYNYSYAPLVKDIAEYIPYLNIEFIEKNDDLHINSNTQLSYVLPISSHNLLSTDVRMNVRNNYKELYDEDVKLQWSFCKYFWESHIEFKNVNVNELNNFILKLKNIVSK